MVIRIACHILHPHNCHAVCYFWIFKATSDQARRMTGGNKHRADERPSSFPSPIIQNYKAIKTSVSCWVCLSFLGCLALSYPLCTSFLRVICAPMKSCMMLHGHGLRQSRFHRQLSTRGFIFSIMANFARLCIAVFEG